MQLNEPEKQIERRARERVGLIEDFTTMTFNVLRQRMPEAFQQRKAA